MFAYMSLPVFVGVMRSEVCFANLLYFLGGEGSCMLMLRCIIFGSAFLRREKKTFGSDFHPNRFLSPEFPPQINFGRTLGLP